MRKLFFTVMAVAVAALVMSGADWPTQSGSPQRDGWARAEKAFTRENAHKIELLYKYKADNQARGLRALTSPMINGMLITYLGFKEMLFFGGSGDNVYAVDADLNRMIWKTHFDYKGDKPLASPTATCPGGLTASLAMPGSSSAAGGRGLGAAPGRSGLFATGFGRSGIFIAVSADGYLHALNTSTGGDKVPPVKFIPPNSSAGPLIVNEGVIYTATTDNCGGKPNAVYALDMSGGEGKLSSFAADASGIAAGTDGTICVQTKDGLHALTRDLQAKESFKATDGGSAASPAASPMASPMVFQWKGKDAVVWGNLHLLYSGTDAPSRTETTAHSPLTFASWEDAPDGPRWVYAAAENSVEGFNVEDRNGSPVLKSVWKAGKGGDSMVTANGLLFLLSGGKAPGGKATLRVLDGLTGKELYSWSAAAYAHDAGLAIANRRIYFTDHSNTVYCLGFMAEQPQLTGR
ncbi:MAG: hypothetical protein ABJC09_00615 [Terriglobia bacterium]